MDPQGIAMHPGTRGRSFAFAHHQDHQVPRLPYAARGRGPLLPFAPPQRAARGRTSSTRGPSPQGTGHRPGPRAEEGAAPDRRCRPGRGPRGCSPTCGKPAESGSTSCWRRRSLRGRADPMQPAAASAQPRYSRWPRRCSYRLRGRMFTWMWLEPWWPNMTTSRVCQSEIRPMSPKGP